MAKLEKKIFLEKNDDLDKAVGSLISASAEKIILNIPKNSVLGSSVHNFQILARESQTAGKELSVESVDEHILEIASLAEIPAVNPVFKTKERVVADILPRILPAEEEKEELEKKSPKRKEGRKKKEPVAEIVEKVHPVRNSPPLGPSGARSAGEISNGVKPERKRPRHGFKFWAKFFSILILVSGGVYWMITDILPRATVNLSIQKTFVTFSKVVLVDTENNAPSVSDITINLPGQLSVAKNNLSMSFPATGKSTVALKASGTLVVYNAYNPQAQVLVATTRFESPDGKIFRLAQRTIIPGAKVVDSQIMPSSVEVKVMADEAGADYNVVPSQGWRIPGFKGTPRYDKFYAEAKSSMTGGASGDQIIPTPEDIQNAKTKIESALADSLKSQTLILSSQNFKLLDNASAFNVASEIISSQVDKDNNFSIFAAGELRQLVFDEKMLQDAIVKSLSTSTAEIKIDDFPINYGTSTVDLTAGKISFSISGTLVYEPKIDFNDFKNQILGKDADSLKATIFALPGLQKANISFWPFWVNSVPSRESRVNIIMGD